MKKTIKKPTRIAQLIVGSMIAGMLASAGGNAVAGVGANTNVKVAYSPVLLNVRGKSLNLIKRGSYLLNTVGSCSGCHTNPEFAEGGNPYNNEPLQINTAGFLAGGQDFGNGIISANITPDANGNPAGLSLEKFITTLTTGQDPYQEDRLLQVMPWPYFKNMTTADLTAIYEYLRAVPSLP